jgi:hypothetical protein
MKTVYHPRRSPAAGVLALFVIAASFAAVSCKNDDNDNMTSATPVPLTVSGNANGAQMVPAVSGNGTATLSGTYDPSTRMLTYTSNWTGFTGRPTTGGFYAGPANVSDSTAAVIGSAWTFDSTATNTGQHQGTLTLTPDQLAALTAGSWFFEYKTKANPRGEVRGKISATQTNSPAGTTAGGQ